MRMLPAAFLVCALAGAASAQPATPTADTPGPLPEGGGGTSFTMIDGNFIGQATGSSQAEQDMARIAAGRAGTQAVRDQAALILRDAGQLNAELRVLARQQGIQVPVAVDQQQRAALTRLQSAPAEHFDRVYLDLAGQLQQRALAQYETELHTGGSPEVKQFAQQAMPMLRAHLNETRQLQQAPRARH